MERGYLGPIYAETVITQRKRWCCNRATFFRSRAKQCRSCIARLQVLRQDQQADDHCRAAEGNGGGRERVGGSLIAPRKTRTSNRQDRGAGNDESSSPLSVD